MSVCLFVLLLARDQKRYDRFHPHVDRLYRAVSERIRYGEVADLYGATPADLGPALARDVPGVEVGVTERVPRHRQQERLVTNVLPRRVRRDDSNLSAGT